MQSQNATMFLKQEVPSLLPSLTEDTPAQWGIMGPQHMMEHLSVLFYFSSKDIGMKVIKPPEELGLSHAWLLTDQPFPKYIQGAGLKVGEPEKLRFKDLAETKARFLKGLNGFFAYFADDPSQTLVHPVFGPLNFEEWLQFHHKHIDHHFRQFGLI